MPQRRRSGIGAAAHKRGMRTDSDPAAPADSHLPAEPRDLAAGLKSRRPQVVRGAAADLVAEATRAVRGLRSRVGLSPTDVEDAIGETLLELIKRAEQGHPVPGAIVQRIATTVCSRFVNGPVRHETAKALRILKERIADAESRAGTSLSRAAVSALAEEVRLGPDFHARHRPVERFHLVEGFTKPTSIDQQAADFIDVALMRAGVTGERGYAGADGACDRLLDDVEVGEVTKAEARRRLWAVVAADEGLPDAAPGRVPRRVADDLQAYVDGLPDGILSACREHLSGRVSRATVAMFAPFDAPGDHGEDAIARYLCARSTFATRLWESALAIASAPRRRDLRPDAPLPLLPLLRVSSGVAARSAER